MFDPRTGELISDAKFDPLTGEPITESSESDTLVNNEDAPANIPVAVATTCPTGETQLPMAMAMATPMEVDQIGFTTANVMHRDTPIAAHTVVVMPDDLSYEDQHAWGREEDSSCAQMGCLLSLFIPVAGWITAYYNIGAPPGSRRRKYAIMSLVIATMSFVNFLLIRPHGQYRPHDYGPH